MKDITKIAERLKKDLEKNNIEGFENVFTVEEGLDLLAEEWTSVGTIAARQLFIKYGPYTSSYVQENIPYLYKLIEDKVEEKEIKAKTKAGLSEEEAKEELERNAILESKKENRIIGYARVSTREQNLGRQIKALEEFGCDVIFQEKKSGKDTNRIEFKAMMGHLKAGDTVVVSELTRLARSTQDLFNIMAELNEKGVIVKSIKEQWLDTSSAMGNFILTMMSGLAQFERELMLERQAEGIAIAKENGVKFGVKLSENADLDLAINMVKEGKYTMTQIAKMCHISRTTLWRRCKDLGIQ